MCFLLDSIFGVVWPRHTPSFPPLNDKIEEVYLVSGPIHFDFVLPVTPEVQQRFGTLLPLGAHENHLIVGWGSEAFYTTAGAYSDVELSAVWTAATGDNAVLRLDQTGPFDVQDYDGLRVELNGAQYTALLDFITGSFQRNDLGNPMPLEGLHLTQSDGFFRATGRFNALRTCNVWVAEALNAAGVPVGIWTQTPFGLRASLALHARADSVRQN